MQDKKAAMLVDRFSTLKTTRSTWESHWQEIADYMLPRKADITQQRTRGDKRNQVIFDGLPYNTKTLCWLKMMQLVNG